MQIAELLDESGEPTGLYIDCTAYKPGHYRCTTPDGNPQPACSECDGFGRCEWTWEEVRLLKTVKGSGCQL